MAHTNWYRYGTISINQNSNHVIGLNTRWADIGIKSGDIFTLDGLKIYEVDTVTDNANLTLKTAFEETSKADVHYCIIRNFTSISTADIVAQMSELRVEMKTYIDTEMSTLQGKSAYELAQDNGFTGTESDWLDSLNAYGVAKKGGYTGTQEEWLESLKAAGEWSSADSRIAALESRLAHIPLNYLAADNPGYSHNLFPRWKNLGTEITAAQYAAISNGTFEDLYVGDCWTLPLNVRNKTSMKAFIAQIGTGQVLTGDMSAQITSNALHIMLDTQICMPFWDAANEQYVAYNASPIKTEVLPEILTALESLLGASHIVETTHGVDDSSEISELGEEHEARVASKIDLFHIDEVAFRTHNLAEHDSSRVEPFALFRHYLKGFNTWPFYNAFWLQETDGQYGFLRHFGTEANSLTRVGQTIGWASVTAHFILVP